MSQPARSPDRILKRLDWTVIRRLDGLLQGDYRTLFQGFGLDLADLREYQFADDVRSIDWNVTARMAEPHVRRYLEDREVTAWFLLDTSPSVDFGTVQVRKRDLLVDFVGVLARLLTRHGNRVGAVLYDGRAPYLLPAGGGRRQVLRLLAELLTHPRLARSPATDLAVPLAAAFRAIRRRSLLFVVSDFISAPGWGKPLGALSRRHEVLAVRLADPREAELPDIGPVVFEDAETGEQLYFDTHDRGFRRRFAEAAVRRERELAAAFRSSGVDALALSTEDDLVKGLLRFAALRRRRKYAPAAASRHAPGAAAQGGRWR
jgi:uncharacterized protein (DUF58 family)